MDFVDAELDEPLPQLLGGDCWDANAEVTVSRVEVVSEFDDVFVDAAVGDGRG